MALFLDQLTPPLRMKYLDRWTAQSRLTAREVTDLRATFTANISEPHVSDLAGNPMQLAILLHLMQRRSVLPEKRTELYDRYIDVFFDRESKNPAIAQHKKVVIEFHKLLAWRIHTHMEQGASSGSVSLEELRRVLTDYLAPRGLDPASIADLFTAVTTRVVCLVQRDLAGHEFQFEVQPLREYFAASYLYDVSPGTGPKNTRASCLADLLKRPFWSNVARFYAGRFTSGEIPNIPYALREIQTDSSVGPHPLSRIAAKLMLDDHVLIGQPELVIKDLVEVIFSGPGPVLAVDGLLAQNEDLLRFQPGVGANQAKEVLLDRLREPLSMPLAPSVAALLDSLGAVRRAQDVWWDQIARVDAAAWLSTAAAFGNLSDRRPDRVQAVDKLFDALGTEDEMLPLLTSSNSDILTEVRVERCIEELRRGHGGPAGERSGTGPYQRLVTTSTAEPLYALLTPADASETPRRRRRQRTWRDAIPPAWTAHVPQLEKAVSDHPRRADRRPWHDMLDTISGVWGGDCWPVRESLLALPADLAPTGEPASVAIGTPWRGVAHWLAEAQHRRGDASWWQTHAEACTDELESMTVTVAALLLATNETVRHITPALNEQTGLLSGQCWTTAAAALQRHSRRHPKPRLLMLEEPLRTGRMKPEGRLAVLTWHVAGQPTRARLYPVIAAVLPTLWRGGASTSAVLIDFAAHHSAVVAVEDFAGARNDIPPGALERMRLKRPTFGRAQDILADPAQWPTDIVRHAAERLSQRMARQPPIADVALAHRWLG